MVALCQYSNIPISHWVIFCLEPIPYIRAHMVNVLQGEGLHIVQAKLGGEGLHKELARI